MVLFTPATLPVAMALDVRLPRFSDEMKEGTVTRWLKSVGDSLSAGEALAEVETEKVIVEVVAPQAGVLLEILVGEQTVVPVDGVLCRIGDRAELPAHAGKGAPAQPVAPPSRAPAPAATIVAMAGRAAREAAPAALARPIQAAAAGGSAAAAAAMALPSGVTISPLARRVAGELGLDVSRVEGTGIGGKIVMSDLQPLLAGRQTRPAMGRASLPAVIPSLGAAAVSDVVEEPHTPLRRAIARRMAESKATIPHFYMTAELDATALLGLRARLNRALPEPRATLNDYFLKAVALALKEVPALNAEYSEAALRRHESVHLGFAVATDAGLFTPVVRDCQIKSIGAIAEDTRGLIARAKARELAPADLQGGTFTVSNLGMFDVVEFAAIINPPQVAILAVARPQERPVAVNGRITVRALLNVTVSADHRALDGLTVARYLEALRGVIQTPERLLA